MGEPVLRLILRSPMSHRPGRTPPASGEETGDEWRVGSIGPLRLCREQQHGTTGSSGVGDLAIEYELSKKREGENGSKNSQ